MTPETRTIILQELRVGLREAQRFADVLTRTPRPSWYDASAEAYDARAIARPAAIVRAIAEIEAHPPTPTESSIR